MFRRFIAFLKRQDLAVVAIAASVIGIPAWIVMMPMPGTGSWLVPNLLMNVVTGLCKAVAVIAVVAALARTLVAHAQERKLLRLWAMWSMAMVLTISLLAVGRQNLVVFTASSESVRYIPASGNHPDVGLWAVTWPTRGSAPEWISEDQKSPLLEAYPRMWKSGEIYLREVALALLMASAWIMAGRRARSTITAALPLLATTIAVLIIGQMVNCYLLWDYDFFFMGIWSDSLLFDLFMTAGFPSTPTLVTFVLALALGLSSLMAMRTLTKRPVAA